MYAMAAQVVRPARISVWVDFQLTLDGDEGELNAL
jgi:hypothetical protein